MDLGEVTLCLSEVQFGNEVLHTRASIPPILSHPDYPKLSDTCTKTLIKLLKWGVLCLMTRLLCCWQVDIS